MLATRPLPTGGHVSPVTTLAGEALATETAERQAVESDLLAAQRALDLHQSNLATSDDLLSEDDSGVSGRLKRAVRRMTTDTSQAPACQPQHPAANVRSCLSLACSTI